MAGIGRSTQVTGRTIEIAERRRQAIELKRAGATYEQIAQQLGYAHRGHAYEDIHVALAHITKQPSEEYVAEQLDRCEAMILHLWPKVRKGDTNAVVAVLRCMDRAAKYKGADAPTRQIISIIPDDVVDAEIMRLTQELATRAAIEQAETDAGGN